jgi:hypothetical protein
VRWIQSVVTFLRETEYTYWNGYVNMSVCAKGTDLMSAVRSFRTQLCRTAIAFWSSVASVSLPTQTLLRPAGPPLLRYRCSTVQRLHINRAICHQRRYIYITGTGVGGRSGGGNSHSRFDVPPLPAPGTRSLCSPSRVHSIAAGRFFFFFVSSFFFF